MVQSLLPLLLEPHSDSISQVLLKALPVDQDLPTVFLLLVLRVIIGLLRILGEQDGEKKDISELEDKRVLEYAVSIRLTPFLMFDDEDLTNHLFQFNTQITCD